MTPVPGTTRDILELSLDIGGLPIIVADTAGLRKTDDVVESIGIERANSALVLILIEEDIFTYTIIFLECAWLMYPCVSCLYPRSLKGRPAVHSFTFPRHCSLYSLQTPIFSSTNLTS